MTITLEDLRPAEGATHKTKRVGRGRSSGRGKTSCRGHNGEGQRSGNSSKRGFEGGQMPGYRQMPKLKGFKRKSSAPNFKTSIFASSSFLADTVIIGTSLTFRTSCIISSPDRPGNIKSKITQQISLSFFNLNKPSVPEKA